MIDEVKREKEEAGKRPFWKKKRGAMEGADTPKREKKIGNLFS